MAIVRLIFVTVKPDQVNDAISLWKNHCAPLMIQQPGCLSEELLECTDAPGEFISDRKWEVRRASTSIAKATLTPKSRNMRDPCTAGEREALRSEVTSR